MNIDYEASIDLVKCILSQDGLENIVKFVRWKINFFDTENPETVQSIAVVETILDTDDLDPSVFISWDNITHSKILEWCLAKHHGNEFLDSLLENGHAANLEHLRFRESLATMDIEVIPV